MKKLALFASLSILLFSCSKVKNGEFLITGKAKGIENGKVVILQTLDESGMQTITLDSVKVQNEQFEFKGKIAEPAIYSVMFQSQNAAIALIAEHGEINIEVYKDSIPSSKVSGTYNNDEFYKFNINLKKEQKIIQKEIEGFQAKNKTAIETAQKVNDTVVLNKMTKEFKAIQKKYPAFFVNYAENNPKSFISVYIIDGMFRSPDVDVKKVEKMYNNLEEDIKNTKPGKKVKEAIAKLKGSGTSDVSVGKKAPNFSAKSPEGKTVSLNENLGKVTIIDFWASWCGPCRKENPNVVALYNEMHSKGLNIVGVSLDKDLGKWKEAIAKDQITWIQMSNLQEWNEPIAKMYKVEQIPTTFLLDANGVIVAKDLRGDELKAKVMELLGAK